MALYRLPFWIAAQRAFSKDEFIDGTDWAGLIDKLNERLL